MKVGIAGAPSTKQCWNPTGGRVRAAVRTLHARGLCGADQRVADLRAAMGRAMLGVVFGGAASPQLVTQIEALFDLVQNPVKRVLTAPFAYMKRARFYDALRALWQAQGDAGKPSLLKMAGESVTSLARMPSCWSKSRTGCSLSRGRPRTWFSARSRSSPPRPACNAESSRNWKARERSTGRPLKRRPCLSSKRVSRKPAT